MGLPRNVVVDRADHDDRHDDLEGDLRLGFTAGVEHHCRTNAVGSDERIDLRPGELDHRPIARGVSKPLDARGADGRRDVDPNGGILLAGREQMRDLGRHLLGDGAARVMSSWHGGTSSDAWWGSDGFLTGSIPCVDGPDRGAACPHPPGGTRSPTTAPTQQPSRPVLSSGTFSETARTLGSPRPRAATAAMPAAQSGGSVSCAPYGPRPVRHAAPHRAASSIASGSSMPAPRPYASAAANESPQP